MVVVETVDLNRAQPYFRSLHIFPKESDALFIPHSPSTKRCVKTNKYPYLDSTLKKIQSLGSQLDIANDIVMVSNHHVFC